MKEKREKGERLQLSSETNTTAKIQRGNGLKKCRFMFALTHSYNQPAPKGTFLGYHNKINDVCSRHSNNPYSLHYFQFCSNLWLNFCDCIPSARLPYKQRFQSLPETSDKLILHESEPSAIMRSKTAGKGDTY